MAGPIPLLTEFVNHHWLESFGGVEICLQGNMIDSIRCNSKQKNVLVPRLESIFRLRRPKIGSGSPRAQNSTESSANQCLFRDTLTPITASNVDGKMEAVIKMQACKSFDKPEQKFILRDM